MTARAAALGAALLGLACVPAFAADRAAEVVSVQGVGESRADDKAAWKPAEPRQELFASNSVRTGSYSRMGLLFADRTQVRLAEKTVMVIKSAARAGAGERTTLRLEQGRSWSQTNVAPANLYLETPSATAAIRGTDWEVEVFEGGRSLLTVFSGEVEYFNEFGRVTVAKNEQAQAIPGQAPVKLLIANPRDRIQWVTAFSPDPSRHIAPAASPAERDRLESIAELIRTDRLEDAFNAALAEMSARPTQPAAWLIASDLMIYQGRLDRATEHAQAGLARFADDARLVAQLARVSLAGGRFTEALQRLAASLAAPQPAFEVRLVGADLARASGEAEAARAGYLAAQAQRPADDRPYFGLGVVDSEREAVSDARVSLNAALERNPKGPGYLGELGTLETLANDFTAADAAFRKALELNASDYVALTGRGVLELKRGDTERALESFLRASLLEPRYARARVYSAVAQYQLGRSSQALQELARASELDDKDPLPYLLASMIQTDLFRASDAIESARRAMRLLPYLKSLNQVANDRQGSANLGRSLSFFGLEDWAQSRAQESYYPYWAGSHLFLADRYPGDFNKNSELLQGFLTDPTVFGSSNRFQSLVSRPGLYGRGQLSYGYQKELELFLPIARVSGLSHWGMPVAYLFDVDALRSKGSGTPGGSGDGNSRSFTGGVGVRPTHELGLFVYGFDQSDDDDTTTSSGGLPVTLKTDNTSRLVSAGLSYKFAPQNQLWVRTSKFDAKQELTGTIQAIGVSSMLDTRVPETGIRHTFDAGPHQLTWGYERASREGVNDWFAVSIDPTFGILVGLNADRYEERSRSAFFSDTFSPTPELLLQADLWLQNNQRRFRGEGALYDFFTGELLLGPQVQEQNQDAKSTNLRVGMRYKFGEQALVRAAFQEWLRPAGFSSLGPVATAGIPVDDRLVSRGGELRRARVQFEVEASPRMFFNAYADHKRIVNRRFVRSPYLIEEDDNLRKLTEFDFGRLSSGDLYEFGRIPEFEAGRITLGGVGLSGVVADTISLSSRYVYTDSVNEGATYPGNLIPYHPRHTAALGLTWVNPARLYFTSRAVYRTLRYTDEANAIPFRRGWDVSFDVLWESPDKRARVRFGIDNGFHNERDTTYAASAVLNF
jgi:Flp pilus assembly protein TadD